MKMLIVLATVVLASVLLLKANEFAAILPMQLHSNSFINNMGKYQLYALSVGMLVTCITLVFHPDSHQFLTKGNLGATAGRESWLGINGKLSWKINGVQLLFFTSMATGIFMVLAVKHTNSMAHFHWHLLPYIFLFSLSNSLSEELIFRFALVGGLYLHSSNRMILLLSGLLFGLPHYVGHPGGLIGVIMAGLLGYILCKATLETKGLSIAWTIHFALDLIIFTALSMIHAGLPPKLQ